MAATGLLSRLRELGVGLSIEGDRLAFDAPAGILDDAILGQMRAQRAGLLAAVRAETAPNAGGAEERRVRCPWCGPVDLLDDPEGLRCGRCERLAWVVEGRSIVRADCVGDDLEGLDPDDVPTCPTCGRWCDTETVTSAAMFALRARCWYAPAADAAGTGASAAASPYLERLAVNLLVPKRAIVS